MRSIGCWPVVYFTQQFRPLGRHFVLRSDHGSLAWLHNFKEPEGQLARWLQKLEEYNFTVVHRPGLKQCNADSLSLACLVFSVGEINMERPPNWYGSECHANRDSSDYTEGIVPILRLMTWCWDQYSNTCMLEVNLRAIACVLLLLQQWQQLEVKGGVLEMVYQLG